MSHRGQLHCLNHNTLSFHSHSMGPSLHSPIHNKMGTAHRAPSQTSENEGGRKRVCKACDRCRMKKSKCDGTTPCSRCRSDNTICVFGERKRSQDKVYPKGYVEALERQQSLVVAACQEMYKMLEAAGNWPTGTLAKQGDGKPLTHDILDALDLLSTKPGSTPEAFEEDPEKLQDRLRYQDASFAPRRGSYSSESDDHSMAGQHDDFAARTPSNPASMPLETKPNLNGLSHGAHLSRYVSESPELYDMPPAIPHSQQGPSMSGAAYNQTTWAENQAVAHSGAVLRHSDFAVVSPPGNPLYDNMGNTVGQWNHPTQQGEVDIDPFPDYLAHQQLFHPLGAMPVQYNQASMFDLDAGDFGYSQPPL